MGIRRVFIALTLCLATIVVAEGRASANPCITGAACSGTTPTCNLLTFSCRACRSDLDCGAPLSGDICVTDGPNAGACINGADAGARNCSEDSECDTLGGYVCSGVACVLGCKTTVFGDTCLFGQHCTFPINFSFSIGQCSPNEGDGGRGGDASTPGCGSDADCGLSSGRVCVQGPSGNVCEPGCHATEAGDTCTPPTKCSVFGGGLGVCVEPSSDGGPTGCSVDSDCMSPGLVCVADQCVMGCHDTAAGDTCPGGAMCSVVGGGLGICVASGTDAGILSCTTDAQCPSGLVCSGGQCIVGCRITDAGDSCPSGVMCSAVNGDVGLCTGSGDGGLGPSNGDGGSGSGSGDGSTGGGPSSSCTTNADCGQGLLCIGSQCVEPCATESDCNGGLVCIGSQCVEPCATDADCNGGLICVSNACVVGCRDTDAGTDTCLLGTGGMCTLGSTGTGQCTGSDGGITPACTEDAQCPQGLVCDSMECVVGCHDTPATGDTCVAGSMCSVVGGGLGVCIGTTGGPDGGSSGGTGDGGSSGGNADGGDAGGNAGGGGSDGGPTSCATDPDCAAGQVCDGLVAECVVGCHDTAAGDTCTPPLRCDAVGGSLGVCISEEGDGGADSGLADASTEPTDATVRDAAGDGSSGSGEPTFEGGGCGCSSAPTPPSEGAGLLFLIGLTVLVRRRISK